MSHIAPRGTLTLDQTAALLQLATETVSQGVRLGIINATFVKKGAHTHVFPQVKSLCQLLSVRSLEHICVMTPDQVAEIFTVHPRVVQLWARTKKLPGIKWGQTTQRFVRSQIATSLLQQNPHASQLQVEDFLNGTRPYYTVRDICAIFRFSDNQVRRRAVSGIFWYLFLPGGTERRYALSPDYVPTVVEWQRLVASGVGL